MTWRQVSAAAEQWDHKAQGLTEAGAAVIALAVAVAVAVASAGTLSQLSAALASALPAGIGGTTVAQAAISAGLRTLVTQASISLVNNQGDIGKVLKQLGSSDSLKSLATAMIAAGLTAGITPELVTAAGLDGAATQSLEASLAQKVLTSSVSAGVQAGVTAAVGGGDLGDLLQESLKGAGVSLVAGAAHEAIGDAAAALSIQDGDALKVIAHGVAGGAIAALSDGDIAAGALAGGVTEAVSPYLDQITTNGTGEDTARLVGGLAAAFAGGGAGDIKLGAAIAGSADHNNRRLHKEEAEKLAALMAEKSPQDVCCMTAPSCLGGFHPPRQGGLRAPVASPRRADGRNAEKAVLQ